MQEEYIPPEFNKDAFHCPHCGVLSHHNWLNTTYKHAANVIGRTSQCSRCGNYTIWVDEKMYYPKSSTAPKAHRHMPDEIRRDYDEARQIVSDSPRASAALLRLALQRLLENHLDTPGGGISDDIGHLVEEGEISPRVKKMLDAVRITGNNSVHPGRMDMDDNQETAQALFKLLNYVIDETIGRDKEIDEFWEELPEADRQGVKNRDAN